MSEIEELHCLDCKTPALHLVDIKCTDAAHPNKVNLHFTCDACGKNSTFRVWGHEGPRANQFYLLTGLE